ncbi:MAG: hypothetical protein CL820_10975 [Croceicoccus sp.]|nr:hypothetical protein [Croceicoccus sp.]MAL26396.1 hypothetical protein [Croceicoccus sp.]|tara:strand:- start:17938 stop:18657 length:720 start_codon:yes stop_codon:yes gene_type:complete
MKELRVANWNVEWRRPNGADGHEIRARLADFGPDIVCLTEAHVDFLEDWGGHTIASPIYDASRPSRRSSVLWSREPWRDLDQLGDPRLPPDCFVMGTTETVIGPLQVAGLIIPYHMAEVATGARNCQMWQQHTEFLDHLPAALGTMASRSIVLGDFNQRIPSTWVPKALQHKLQKAFEGHAILTTQVLGPDGRQAIDHIAIPRGMQGRAGPVLSNERAGGGRLSDHFGVTAVLEFGEAA